MKNCNSNRPFWLILFSLFMHAAWSSTWTESEMTLLRMQWLGSLPALPPDPSNRVADDKRAVEFGRRLFFDGGLSANGKVSCASCHVPAKAFTDGLARSRGISETGRSAPSLLGAAYSPWLFWDGRSDSLWSQALGPLESSAEHGGNRLQYARRIASDPDYRADYEALFGALPDLDDRQRFPMRASPVGDDSAKSQWAAMRAEDRKAVTRIFVNLGKVIAAFERTLLPGASRFDRYVERVLDGDPAGGGELSAEEIAGLRLFMGKAMCVTCHMGPMFTNHGFHNIGAPDPATEKPRFRLPLVHLFADKKQVDLGRYQGVKDVKASEFNCLGEYSDAGQDDCAELKFANTQYRDSLGMFKVPTLRNVARTAPYMHAGQMADLGEVLRHYNNPPKAPSGQSELAPLNLNARELAQIEAFLRSLDSQPTSASGPSQAGL